ncbi:hypothetical protein EZS27_011341, partial [termite gut metagenome]
MQILKSIIHPLLLASSIGFVACTERMDIDVNDAPVQLAIYGSITTDTTQHSVTVRQSSNYFSNFQPVGISHVTVTISDGDTTFTLSESQNGEYLTDADVFGIEGKTYTLKIIVEFNGITDEYEATSYLPYSIQVNSIKLQPSNMGTHIVDALLYGRLPESNNNYLNIRAYKNDNIPLNANLSDFNIIKSENVEMKEIDGAVCMNLRTSGTTSNKIIIEQGDLVTFQVCSITKEYADYVLNVQKELQGSIPIFSGPPANVQTNISAKSAS